MRGEPTTQIPLFAQREAPKWRSMSREWESHVPRAGIALRAERERRRLGQHRTQTEKGRECVL